MEHKLEPTLNKIRYSLKELDPIMRMSQSNSYIRGTLMHTISCLRATEKELLLYMRGQEIND